MARPAAAITGIADTRVGKVPDRDSMQLHAEAVRLAVADAGITLKDVDGLVTGNSRVSPYLYHADVLAEYLGIHPRHALTVTAGGSTSASAIEHAAAMVAAGVCRNVVVVKADNLATGMGRSATIESMSTIGHPEFEAPYGPLIPALYALLARRYMHEYKVTEEDFAAAAATDRYHASLNPAAQFRTPITVDDVLNSRMIADPLHMLDCAPVSDGGAAVVVSAAEEARDRPHRPAYLLGFGEYHDFEHVTQATELATTGARFSGAEAFRRAGVRPEDIDVAMVYDAFSFIQCMQLEDLGFCDKGAGGAFVREGHTRLGGRLPVNTHGGVLSYGHPGKPTALFQFTEAVRQLRGDCGERQVPDARLALVHSEGGILASHCTAILGVDQP